MVIGCSAAADAAPYPDRFVWIFGWGLNKDEDVAEITKVLETAGRHGLNGAVVSFGLDTLCKKSDDYFRRLDAIKQACDRNKLELIPAIFSVGYGGAALAHDKNLAEGVSVEDAPFLVRGNEARFVPDAAPVLANGGFEEFTGDNPKSCWSDMLDPNHNAHGDYYLVSGDFTGSWKHVPKDLTIAVWGGEPREKSLKFFADQGFPTLAACYYDADDLSQVNAWLTAARQVPNVRGFMYTPWQRKYALLPAFGEILRDSPAAP